MNRIALALACCSLLSVAAQAQETTPPATAGEYKTNTEKVSYGIGWNIGSNLVSQDLGVDFELVKKGFADALAKADQKVSDEDIQAAMVAFQEELQKKMVAKREADAAKNAKDGPEFLAKNGKRPEVKTTESGLQYEVLKAGDGASPKATDTVTAHYHGTLLDGTVFDSSVDRGEPLSIPVNRVIPGWTEALQLMKVGDKWKLFIPAELAYGEHGSGPTIGPNAALIFEVELLSIPENSLVPPPQ